MSNYRIATKSGKPFGADWMKGFRDGVVEPLNLEQQRLLESSQRMGRAAAGDLLALKSCMASIGLDLQDITRAQRAVFLCEEILSELRNRATLAHERYLQGRKVA